VGTEQGILPGCGSVVAGEAEGESQVKPEAAGGKPRYEVIEREQLCWRRVDVERLIGEEHAARGIWEFVWGSWIWVGTRKRYGRWRAKRDGLGGSRGY
jgi:hypothetical protein